MPLLILGSEDVRELLPMNDCIEVMDRAMRAASSGSVEAPHRSVAALREQGGHFFLMPGSMPEPPAIGAKLVTLLPSNPARGLQAVQGFIALFDFRTGEPLAVIDGSAVTAIRTAAASALAVRELARRTAGSHGIFGTGTLARTHLEAVYCVRDVARVVVWGRDRAKTERFVSEHSGPDGPKITATEKPQEAAACDIVSVVTGSGEPVLHGEWLQPGAHVSLVGAHTPETREADSATMARAVIYVDLLASALEEAGDILIPIREGRIVEQDIAGEVGQVLEGTVPGRRDDAEITLYKSLGVVAQDLFAAERLYQAAVREGKGQLVDFP
jgi:ornithine cyclodeaminase